MVTITLRVEKGPKANMIKRDGTTKSLQMSARRPLRSHPSVSYIAECITMFRWRCRHDKPLTDVIAYVSSWGHPSHLSPPFTGGGGLHPTLIGFGFRKRLTISPAY